MLENVKDLHGDTPEDELSAAQLYERLQGAKLVTANLEAQISLLKDVAESLREQVLRDKREMDTVLRSCRDIARHLSLCGSDDHKGKNEAILRTVARLLTLEWNYSEPIFRPAKDEIPF